MIINDSIISAFNEDITKLQVKMASLEERVSNLESCIKNIDQYQYNNNFFFDLYQEILPEV